MGGKGWCRKWNVSGGVLAIISLFFFFLVSLQNKPPHWDSQVLMWWNKGFFKWHLSSSEDKTKAMPLRHFSKEWAVHLGGVFFPSWSSCWSSFMAKHKLGFSRSINESSTCFSNYSIDIYSRNLKQANISFTIFSLEDLDLFVKKW